MSLRQAIDSLSTRRRCTRMSKGGLTPRYDDRCILVARWRGRMTAKSTRHHALGRMTVSGLEMMYFSLCKIAQSEPSGSGAGTWRRQAHSQAAPGCRWVRVQHERTGAMARKNTPASPARWVMDQLHKRDTTTGRPTSAHTSSTKHQPALSDEGHNMAHRPREQGQRCEVTGGGSGVVRSDRANGESKGKDTVLEMRPEGNEEKRRPRMAISR